MNALVLGNRTADWHRLESLVLDSASSADRTQFCSPVVAEPGQGIAFGGSFATAQPQTVPRTATLPTNRRVAAHLEADQRQKEKRR